MSNAGDRKGNDPTSSGHGALGMGGRRSDDPRDSNSGGGNHLDDDRGGGTGLIPGAHGRPQADTSGDDVAGVKGDAAVEEEIGTARKRG